MNGLTAYALSKRHTNDTVDGLGYLKGAPCTIKSTTETDDGTIVVFEWTGNSGTAETTSILVKNGKNGQAQTITTTRTADDDGVVITVVNPDGSTASTATIYDGDSGEATSIDWSKIENRPFITLSVDDFEVDENGVLSVVISGEGNKIDSISVNGTALTPDANKNVDITVPTVSTETDNLLKTKADGGLYVAPTDLSNYVEKVDGKDLSTNDLTDEMVEKIGNTYTKTEVDTAITNAQLGGEEVDLTAYVKTETLTEELAKYSTTEVSDEKYVLDEEIQVLSEADVLALLNLSTEELEGLSQIIDDNSVRIDKTNSSSFIYQSIQDAIATGKKFTLSELAKVSTASYKVVSDTTSVIDSKYIYLIANSSNSYDMYILDETDGAVRIGETTIDLSGYLTTETANQTYVLQTVFDVLSGNIGDVASLVTENKTVVAAINEVKENLTDYLPLSGGTLTGGTINLANGYGKISSGKKSFGIYAYDDVSDRTNARTLILIPKTYQENANEALVFHDVIDGTSTDYTVLHSGNIGDYTANGARNLIQYPYFESTVTRSGIEFTDNGNGTITVKGTSTDTSMFNVRARVETDTALILSAGTYTLSGCPSGGSGSTYRFWVGTVDVDNNATFIGHDIGEGYTFTLTETTKIAILFQVYSGQTFNGEIVTPMLEVGSVAHDYVPYNYGNADTLDGKHASDFAPSTHFITDPNDPSYSAMQAIVDENIYRLQIQNNGEAHFYTSTDSGTNWEDNGNVIHSGNIEDYIGKTTLDLASVNAVIAIKQQNNYISNGIAYVNTIVELTSARAIGSVLFIRNSTDYAPNGDYYMSVYNIDTGELASVACVKPIQDGATYSFINNLKALEIGNYAIVGTYHIG